MKLFIYTFFFLISSSVFSQEKVNYQKVSEVLLQNIIDGKSYKKQVKILEKSTLNEIIHQLSTDTQKIAFWVNIYNAFIQISLSENPDLYKNRSPFFSDERIKIAG